MQGVKFGILPESPNPMMRDSPSLSLVRVGRIVALSASAVAATGTLAWTIALVTLNRSSVLSVLSGNTSFHAPVAVTLASAVAGLSIPLVMWGFVLSWTGQAWSSGNASGDGEEWGVGTAIVLLTISVVALLQALLGLLCLLLGWLWEGTGWILRMQTFLMVPAVMVAVGAGLLSMVAFIGLRLINR